jgi:AcrR family transcriptional regulator
MKHAVKEALRVDAQEKATRNPERTTATVLDAAEALFAEKGYDAVSLGEIGRKAGVSRGTPSHLFGSKKGLYRAVVERMAEDVKDLVVGTRPHTEVGVAGRRPEDAIAYGIGAYVDFLASRPNFVRMMEREVLDAGRLSEGGSEEGAGLLTESLGDPGTGLLAEDLRHGPFREVDARQLVVSIIALCFFPFAHAGGYSRG